MAEEKSKNEIVSVEVEVPKNRTLNEELEITGNQLVERVKALIQEGSVRRVIIRDAEGRTLLEVPLTIGAVAGGAMLVFLPLWAGLAAIGALLVKARIEIVREITDDEESI
ncbi:MAG: DUF4342 domain-containing protein [Chloroflexota bacterium]|nr:DUF4342 domain-containing protein [Chloroflexota bacterium]